MSLSNLIVQREIASIREVEEALARQVLYGGDLITNLLEVCRLDEALLLPIVAESLGLPPARPGELPRLEAEAMRLVAAEVAVERNLAPMSVDRYGLTLAVAEPLSSEVEQELTFALALPISQKVAPLVRIREALARDYGVPLERRLERLLQRMKSEGPRTSSSFPTTGSAEHRLGAPRPPSIVPPPPPHSKPAQAAVVASTPPGAEPRTLVRGIEAPPARPMRRRRGAITADVARTELEEAGERDTIFDLLFEFSRQYFDYTAVFIVHGEVAEGRDAFGDGAPRDKVARIGVPLDLPSMLSAAREKKTTIQRVPESAGLDAILVSDLGRPGKTLCVVVPVVVRKRVVAMLLGDGGEAGVDAPTLADVERIVTQASAAFERLVVRRKLRGSLPPGENDSVLPGATSNAPPIHVGEVSDRPAVEELAQPIRDLMMEPLSRLAAPAPGSPARAVAQPDVPVVRIATDKPPPANVLVVRRPSGAPIPREEPESQTTLQAVEAAFDVPAAAAVPDPAADGPRRKSSSSALHGVRRRGQAPKLDFNTKPPQSVSVGIETFGAGETFGADETERRLLAEIHGHPDDSAPKTVLDPSPRAESPGPLPVAAAHRRLAITEQSPTGLPMFDGPIVQSPLASSDPYVQTVDVADPDVSVVDPDPTPAVPMVDMDDVTPFAPPVSSALTLPAAPPPASSPIPDTTRVPMPASEQQISFGARRLPPSRSDLTRVLPSVMVDVASEYVSLVDRVLAHGGDATPGGSGDDDAENELLRAGGHAMPAIMARFPGPVTVEAVRLSEGVLPRVAECGPVLRLVASQRRTALPFVLALVEDPDVERRFWATYLLTELVYPEVLEPIVFRLFDDEPRVRRVARAAARAFADTHPATMAERLEDAATDAEAGAARRILAIEAVGETREPLGVPALIRLLEDPEVDVVNAARGALTLVARQDFGISVQKWSAWWMKNRERHRLEWLIDALMHGHAALRAVASDELKATTKEFFGYYPDLPKRECERTQARYREWWNTVGRVRFSRPSSSRG